MPVNQRVEAMNRFAGYGNAAEWASQIFNRGGIAGQAAMNQGPAGEQPPAGGVQQPQNNTAGAGGAGGAGGAAGGGAGAYNPGQVSGSAGGGGVPAMTTGNIDPRVAEILFNQGKLPELDEATLAELAKQRQAALEQANYTYGRDRASMLEDLFGRGVQRSTIAGDVGERMLGQRAMVLAQIEADAANRQLGLQSDIAGRVLQGASAYGDLDVRQQATRAQENVGLAEVGARQGATAAQLQIAQLDDATRRWLGEQDIGIRTRELDQQADQFARSMEYDKWALKANKPKWWEKVLGGVASIFSSAQFKDVVDTTPDTAEALTEIVKVPLFKWNYKGEDRVRLGPVIEASSEEFSADGLTLDITNIFGMLIGAIQEQQKTINELKEKLDV